MLAQVPRTKRLIPKQMLRGQPNSAGSGWSTSDSSWSATMKGHEEQLVSHQSSSYFMVPSLSNHLPRFQIFPHLPLLWSMVNAVPLSSPPTPTCGHLSGLWEQENLQGCRSNFMSGAVFLAFVRQARMTHVSPIDQEWGWELPLGMKLTG